MIPFAHLSVKHGVRSQERSTDNGQNDREHDLYRIEDFGETKKFCCRRPHVKPHSLWLRQESRTRNVKGGWRLAFGGIPDVYWCFFLLTICDSVSWSESLNSPLTYAGFSGTLHEQTTSLYGSEGITIANGSGCYIEGWIYCCAFGVSCKCSIVWQEGTFGEIWIGHKHCP